MRKKKVVNVEPDQVVGVSGPDGKVNHIESVEQAVESYGSDKNPVKVIVNDPLDPEPSKMDKPEPAQVSKPTTITVNTKFIVRPTATGTGAMQATHDAMLTKLGSAVRGAFPRNVLKYRACDDAPGYVTYTLLEMLQQFGPDVALGKALPFEDEVVVVEEK